jgi:hypothetical protein
VTITQIVDSITVTLAELRTSKGRLRVQGSVGIYSSVQNKASFYNGDDKGQNVDYDPLKKIGEVLVDLTGLFSFRVDDGIDLTALSTS